MNDNHTPDTAAPKRKRPTGCLITGAMLALAAVGLAVATGNSDDTATPPASAPTSATATATPGQAEPSRSENAENVAALGKAQSYAENMHMSRAAIRGQLEYEKFPPAAVDYAIENVTADWVANATEKAKTYRSMNMSTAAIRDQLASEYGEQFTRAEADAAVAALVQGETP